MNREGKDETANNTRGIWSTFAAISVWSGVYVIRLLLGCVIWGVLVGLLYNVVSRTHPEASTLRECPNWYLSIIFGVPLIATAAIAFLPVWRKMEKSFRGRKEAISAMRLLLLAAGVLQIFTVLSGTFGIGIINYLVVGCIAFLTTLALDESRPRQFLLLLIATSQAHVPLLAAVAVGFDNSGVNDESLGLVASYFAIPAVALLGWLYWRCRQRLTEEAENTDTSAHNEEPLFVEKWLKSNSLAIGLGALALLFSLIPILSIPAAVGAMVLGIPRLGERRTKVPSIIAIVLATLSIPVAITSAISGVAQANALNERLRGKANIEWVHREMSKCMGGEIQSAEHMQRVVRMWARIDVSGCPEEYQEVYEEMIEVATDVAFYTAKNNEAKRTVLIFLESLIQTVLGDASGSEDLRLRDEELQLRMERVQNKLGLVCAKYGAREAVSSSQ